MLLGYSAGTGIDQIWHNDQANHYLVVEAKGPGAQLREPSPFTERGGAGIRQMSRAWIANRLRSMGNSQDDRSRRVYANIVADCGLSETGAGKLLSLTQDPNKTATHKLSGVTVTMQFNDKGILEPIHEEELIFDNDQDPEDSEGSED